MLKNRPIPGEMPTHSLARVLGPLAETSNLSTPRQGVSTLQRNPCKMRQTTDFHLIKNFCCCQPLPTLIQNSDFCLGPRQWDKAAPTDAVCKGNPSLFNLGMHSIRDSISPHIPYLSLSCTPTVKAEGKTVETQCSSIIDLGCYSSRTWGPTWARRRTPHENSLPKFRLSPRANLTFWSIDLGAHCSPCFPPPLPPHVGSEVII